MLALHIFNHSHSASCAVWYIQNKSRRSPADLSDGEQQRNTKHVNKKEKKSANTPSTTHSKTRTKITTTWPEELWS